MCTSGGTPSTIGNEHYLASSKARSYFVLRTPKGGVWDVDPHHDIPWAPVQALRKRDFWRRAGQLVG